MEPVSRNGIRNGLICESAVAENDFPKDAVVEAVNFHFDTIGEATLRKGKTLLGDSLSGNILGLFHFVSDPGSNSQLITVKGEKVYYLSNGTWSEKRNVTSGQKARFTAFLNYVFMVNGTDATAVWDGNASNSFVTTGNASGAPIGKFIETFKARVWIAGNSTYPDRLFYSSLPSSVTTPIITWDTSVTIGDWIDISPSDGDNITALKRSKDALLVFKRHHIYRVSSTAQADLDSKINVGTYSQESVVEAKNGIYFFHPTGFYRYDGGVQEISKPVKDFLENITLANYTKVCGALETNGDNIRWSVGDVTVKGITYFNVELRYTISSQVWTVYSGPTQHLVASSYDDGTTRFSLVGDEDGNILKLDVGTTDNSTAVSYSIGHQFDNLDGLNSTRKTLTKMQFLGEMTGAKVSYQAENDKTNDWTKNIGEMKHGDTLFPSLSIKGKKFKFRLSGSSVGEPVRYRGFEVLEGKSELIQF